MVKSESIERFNISGGCHCGAVTYHYHSPLSPDDIPVRACDCTFCTKHGARYTSHPDGALEVNLADSGSLTGYSFGTGTGEAQFCTKCGVYLFMFCTIEQKLFAALNVNSFQSIDLQDKEIPRLQLSDDPVDKRLKRRVKFWIPDVQVSVRAE